MASARAVMRLMFLLAVQFLFAFIALVLHLLKRISFLGDWRQVLDYKNLWARCCCRCLNIKVRVRGTLPHGPMLVVANHVGSPDIFILGSLIRGFFVSKADVGNWPLVGTMLVQGGTLLVDRAKRQKAGDLKEIMKERLSGGYPVILFPEGQASDGSSLLPFKPAGFQAAIESGCPVLPIAIRYHDGNTPSVACWSERTFFSHLWALLKFPKLEATVEVLPAIENGLDRKSLAFQSHKMIADHLESNPAC